MLYSEFFYQSKWRESRFSDILNDIHPKVSSNTILRLIRPQDLVIFRFLSVVLVQSWLWAKCCLPTLFLGKKKYMSLIRRLVSWIFNSMKRETKSATMIYRREFMKTSFKNWPSSPCLKGDSESPRKPLFSRKRNASHKLTQSRRKESKRVIDRNTLVGNPRVIATIKFSRYL